MCSRDGILCRTTGKKAKGALNSAKRASTHAAVEALSESLITALGESLTYRSRMTAQAAAAAGAAGTAADAAAAFDTRAAVPAGQHGLRAVRVAWRMGVLSFGWTLELLLPAACRATSAARPAL
jgi:hypothetical protein